MQTVCKGYDNVNKVYVMGIPSDYHFNKIKKMMPADDVSKKDIFSYKVVLCDNMVDRDNEMFSDEALKDIQNKFIGVVGIEDHNPTVKNNHSRIYDTEIKEDVNIKNVHGDNYKYVVAYAYTINNDKNKELIDEIRTGIKKEVSIGFKYGGKECNICGKKAGLCEHVAGLKYNKDGIDTTCVHIYKDVSDGFEWSFVSVPAQRGAGIVKNYSKEETRMHTIKELALEIAPLIPSDVSVKLMKAVADLEVPKDDLVTKLQGEVKQYKEDLAAKSEELDKLIESNNDKLLEEAIESIFKELVPVNDVMKNIAKSEISEIVVLGEHGHVVGVDEAITKLSADEYKPLFSKVDVVDEDGGTNIDIEDKEEKEIDVEEEFGVKNYSAKGLMSRHKELDFNKVSNQTKGAKEIYQSKFVGTKIE